MISLPLYWWYIPMILFVIPIIYGYFRKSGGQFDFGIDLIIIFSACWWTALGICAGKLIAWATT